MADAPLAQNRAFGGVIDILDAMGVEYLIWGGVATVMYGEPRFTQDMDVVIRLGRDQVDTLARLFEEDGYYVSVEAIHDALERHFYFNVIHLETNIKVDFCIAGRDPVLSWAFEHRQLKQFDEFRHAAYMPPEAVILTKLQAFQSSKSTRHLDDIGSILRVSGPKLDLDHIGREAVRIGASGIWCELLDRNRL
jgi:hypothetical protein